MARKGQHVTVLQVSESALSLFRAKHTERGIDLIDTALKTGVWSIEDGSLPVALKAFVTENAVGNDTVIAVLPRQEVTVRILTLPSRDPVEIKGMVALGVEEYVPYPAAEVIADSVYLGPAGEGYGRVLAAFAHDEVVESYLTLLRAAGIEPEAVCLSTACLASAVLKAGLTSEVPTAFTHLSPSGLEALVFGPSGLEYSRGVALPGDCDLHGPQATAIVEEVAIETRATISAHRRESEHAAAIDNILFSSELASSEHMLDALAGETGLDCRSPLLLDKLITSGRSKAAGAPLIAIGAILTFQNAASVPINLLPKKIQEERAADTIKRKSVYLAIAIVIALVGALSNFSVAVHQRQAHLAYLKAHIASIAPNVEGVLEKQRQLSILQEQVQREGTVLEIIAGFCQAAPRVGLNVGGLSFRYKRSMGLHGRALDVNIPYRLSEDLRASGVEQFSAAKTIYTHETKERDTIVQAYGVEIPFPQVSPDQEEGDE